MPRRRELNDMERFVWIKGVTVAVDDSPRNILEGRVSGVTPPSTP